MTIYLIRNTVTNNIKIGYTESDPTPRMSSLQVGSCADLEVLMTFKGSYVDEKKLHKECAHLKIRGEWFKPGCIKLCKNYFAPKRPSYYNASVKIIECLSNEELSIQEENRLLRLEIQELRNEIAKNKQIISKHLQEIKYWRNASRLITDAYNEPAIMPIVQKQTRHKKPCRLVKEVL